MEDLLINQRLGLGEVGAAPSWSVLISSTKRPKTTSKAETSPTSYTSLAHGTRTPRVIPTIPPWANRLLMLNG